MRLRRDAVPEWHLAQAPFTPPPRRRPSRLGRLARRLLLALVVLGVCAALGTQVVAGRIAIPWFGPTHNSLDALSADMATYARRQGANMGIVVHDVTHNRDFSYNETTPFIMASSAKIIIMLSYLDTAEGQGHVLTADDKRLLTDMITVSDNDAAQTLYERVGWNPGQQRFLQKIGVNGYAPNADGWGWGALPPASMERVLSLLYDGQVLNATDRTLALRLLSHVSSDQQWGVGASAPQDATVYMKDGWVTGPDNLWAMNSSGIVVTPTETYIIAVFTQHQSSYDWSKVQHICDAVAQALA